MQIDLKTITTLPLIQQNQDATLPFTRQTFPMIRSNHIATNAATIATESNDST